MTGERFYGDLAPWWPLISPPEEYVDEAAQAARILASAAIPVRDVLELGSGGGHNAVHLKQRFELTLVDLSAAMLEVSRTLNPECEHIEGDMRSVRLDRTFDAVFVHDAVDYMTSKDDLRRAMQTAFAHCRPGGLALFVPDHTAETYAPGTDHGGTDDAHGCGVRYLEWSWDPDPTDSWVMTVYTFVLHHGDGTIETVHETHRHGVFPTQTWLGFLAEVGFVPDALAEETSGDRPPRTFFVGRRPIA